MAIASLVLGIFSVLFALAGPFSFIGIVLGAIGIVLGVLARKQEPSDIATGGMVTSIVGCGLALLVNIACIACITGGKKMLEEAVKDPQVSKSFNDFTQKLKEMEKEANKQAEKNKKF